MKKNRLDGEDTIRFDVNNKLPHRDKMLLIDGTAYKDGDKLILSITIPMDTIFTDQNKVVTPLVMIEMLAQLCGAQYAFEKNLDQNKSILGYLVGVDKVEFLEPVYGGDQLDLIARVVIEMETISRIKGEVFRDDVIAGKAELTLYKTEEWIRRPKTNNHQRGLIRELSKKYDHWADKSDAVGKGIIQSINKIEIKHGESVEATMSFQPDFVCFAGHFPGYPVLPAVVILYTGWLLAEMCSNRKLDLSFINKARFVRAIFPSDIVNVVLKRLSIENEKIVWYIVKVLSNGDLLARYEIGTNIA